MKQEFVAANPKELRTQNEKLRIEFGRSGHESGAASLLVL